MRRGLGIELPLSMLLLRSSSLDIALGLVLTRSTFGSAATLGRRCAAILLKPLTSVGVVGLSACTVLGLCDEVGREYSSLSARQSSVMLRQTLSALRLSCRSVTPEAPIVLAALETGPGCPALPIIVSRASESVARHSSALYDSEPNSPLDFASAAWSSGCASLCPVNMMLPASAGCPFATYPGFRFGELDTLVAVVFAVYGRSSETRDMAAPEVEGSLPVNSSRLMRDFKSSNSSHTVEGPVVEAVDSVPSGACADSGACCGSALGASGEEWYTGVRNWL